MNHFPGMYNIHKKNNLAKNLNKVRKIFPKEFDFYPKTFMLPSESKELLAEFGVYDKRSKWLSNGKFVALNKLRSKSNFY